jgi:hypothetical protein
MDTQYIEDIFSHHPPKDESVVDLHASVRLDLKEIALRFNASLPDSPEKALAIRHLQQAMMFANAAIAIYS